MELKEAESLALTLMQAHGVGHWNFKFDRAVRRLGLCDYSKRTISISAPLSAINTEDVVANAILHEIAHALAGSRAGHGPEWRRTARSIGHVAPTRTIKAEAPPMRYVALCASCGYEHKRSRRPSSVQACGRCCKTYNYGRFTIAYELKWVDTRAKVA